MDFFPRRGFDFGLDLFRDNSKDLMMKTDISEKENSYLMELDILGMQKENISINYQDGYLTVEAKKEQQLEETKDYIRKERIYGEYKRSFYVGNIEEKDIKANYENGTLTIEFPKEQSKTTKKSITID